MRKNILKIGMAITLLISIFGNILAQTTFSITVPEGASVYVGAPEYSGYNYKPFTEKAAISTSTNGGKTTYNYNVSGKHNYRVSQKGMLTQAGVFTPSGSSTSLEIKSEQLSSYSPRETDRDVNNNNGYNVANIFLNINEKGHLKLSSGDTYQLVNLRTWTMVDNTVTNYFLEPDYHYTVINENGEVDNSVVTVDGKGLIKAVGKGTAIVLVTYDAINLHSAAGGPFFGALWSENTGVFVVSVDAPVSSITSGMLINETKNTNSSHKMVTTAVDTELDVFYYLKKNGGFDFSFTPSNVVSVELAQPEIIENTLNFSGFSTENVTKNADESYTVRLINGRNIVKMTSASGAVEYQVLTAKTVTYTVSNLTNPAGKINPGDEVSVKFTTFFHPCGKLPGIYNMSAGIQYNDVEANVAAVGGVAQHTFASKAQEYKITIPLEFTGNEFLLTNGVIKANGYGSPYGSHRNITLENGIGEGLNASLRTAYFGALPNISIPLNATNNSIEQIDASTISVYPNPFTDYIIVNTIAGGTAAIYNLSGNVILSVNLKNGSNRIETSAWEKGVYVLKMGEKTVKVVK